MGHESARMILDVYEHADWAQKVKAIEAMPDFFGSSLSLPHKRNILKHEINDEGTRQGVGNAVSEFQTGKTFPIRKSNSSTIIQRMNTLNINEKPNSTIRQSFSNTPR